MDFATIAGPRQSVDSRQGKFEISRSVCTTMADSAASSATKRRYSTSPAVRFNISAMTSPSPGGGVGGNDTTINRSVFTPVLTPSGADRGNSMVLLSPSRTIAETLTQLASSTGHQLEEIWDEVGYSPEDRAAQLSDLIVQFRDICENKISEERAVSETFRQTIAEAKEEMKTLSASLHIDTAADSSSNALNNSRNTRVAASQTLSDELATLEAALESLRTAAATAQEDIRECHEYLVEAHAALGIDMDPSWNDTESDLTVRRREQFHKKKSEMKEELSTRTAAVVQLVRDCQQLTDDLCMDPETDSTTRRIAGSLVRSKDGSFIMASKQRSETCVGISSKALEELTKQVAKLHKEKLRRKQKLQQMGGEIAVLWEKLRVPVEEQMVFTKSVQGLGTDTMEKGEAELERLHLLKAEMLGNLIAEARDAITDLWDQTNATLETRQSFAAFYVRDESLFDDELLEKHDEYIAALQARLEQMRPILRLIERREAVLQERYEYEELQKDSDRLKQRGAAMTKQLMAEEKMAKRIKRDLPKLTEHLIEKLAEWNEKHGSEFQFKGEVYLDVIARQEVEWKQYKEGEIQRKLKKKQEEKAHIDNRYTGGGLGLSKHAHRAATAAGATRPLGDGTMRSNVTIAPNQRAKSRPKARGQSHDVSKITTNTVPARTMGQKQTSSKF